MAVLDSYEKWDEYVQRLVSNNRQPSRIRLDLEDNNLRDLIGEAIQTYSRLRPRILRHKLDGDGTAFQWVLETEIVTVGKEYDKDFSSVHKVWYTDDSVDERIPMELHEEDDFEIKLRTDDNHDFVLWSRTPASTENVEIEYTRVHTVSDTEVTIPLDDRHAVCNLVASLVFEMFADRAASDYDAETGESGELSTMSDQYEERGIRRKKLYELHLSGQTELTNPAPIAVSSKMVSRSRLTGERRFSHNIPRRRDR